MRGLFTYIGINERGLKLFHKSIVLLVNKVFKMIYRFMGFLGKVIFTARMIEYQMIGEI